VRCSNPPVRVSALGPRARRRPASNRAGRLGRRIAAVVVLALAIAITFAIARALA
jgi:hypothetical protein